MSADPHRPPAPDPREPDESGRFPMKRAQLLDVLAGTAGLLSRGHVFDIDAVLRLIGESAGVDRMYLFENGTDADSGRTVCSQRFEWAHGSVSAEIDNPALQNLPYDAISDVLEDVLRRGDAFYGITRDLEPRTREILEPQGILSICIVPVITDEQLWGFVGFDDCHTERPWNDEEIAYLRLIAAILAGYFFRERMRAALASREEQYRALVDNVHEVIFESDPEGRFTFLNRAWQQHLGYSITETIGTTMCSYLAEDARDAARASLEDALAARAPACWTEARFVSREGEERWMQVVCRFRRDAAGALVGILGTMADITERRWAHEALRRRQLDESLSTLAGGIAHDLNNVLHGMLSAAEVLALRSTGDARSAELVSVIQTSGERMADMTRQLLAYARGGPHETTLLDPAQLVQDALKIARVPPDVRIDVTSPEGLAVKADRGQLFQVVLNLVVNAVEAMSGRGLLRIEVASIDVTAPHRVAREHMLAPGPYVQLSFADEGSGIEGDALPRIFEPFFSTKARGRGLGLAAARGIIASHGGAISVRSELGRGSTFDVLLPRREGDTREVRPERPAVTGGLVLLVDDEESILRMTAESLETAGYRVLVAKSGHEALELFDRWGSEIDAALVDYLMPDMNGGDLIRALRGRAPDLAVVLCTGYSGDDAATGLEDVPRLEKPFPTSALLAILSGAAR